MICKRIKTRKDGKSSASDALSYGEGLKVDRETGELLDKSHRTRIGNFGLVDDGVYAGRDVAEMAEIINLAAIEMQANCDQNTKVGADKKLAHFVVSFNQDKPSEAVLRDTEDSMLAAMELDKNHFATFLHNDNGYWHLHIFASRIEKEKPHRGNSLWHDQINRDKVCREVEARHGLQPDNGMHRVNELGQIIEIPRAERQAKREAKPAGISDRAKTTEIYSGEKSFQSWANEIRLGDRLKHAKSWKDIHAAAAAFGCEIKEKGAGLVICPIGQKGALSLSKIGLTKLPAKFGAFQQAAPGHQVKLEKTYEPGPALEKGKSHYSEWKEAKGAFKSTKTGRINAQREAHARTRLATRAQQKTELTRIRAAASGQDRVAAVSVAKMRHTVELAVAKNQFAQDRQRLRDELAGAAPGNTFRDYLVLQASKGDSVALGLARRYGVQEATDVLRQREAKRLKIVAAIDGKEYRPAPRMNFTHQVERNGTVVYDFGQGRRLTDSAISKQIQLNDAAAHSPEAIATALTFATTKFGNTLTLSGPAEFQRLAVETAVLKHLGIKFADPALEAYRAKFAAEQKPIRRARLVPDLSHLTPNQIAKGVEDVLTRTLDRGRPPEHVIRAEQYRQSATAQRSRGVHELPAGSLDAEGRGTGVLLPDALHGGLGDEQARQDQDLRRTGTGATGGASDRNAGVDAHGAEHDSRAIRRGNTVVRVAGGEIGSNKEKQIRPIGDVPVIPSNKPAQRGIKAPVPMPEAQQQPGTQAVDYDYDPGTDQYAEEHPVVDHLADIHRQIDVAKAAAEPRSMLAHSTTTNAENEAQDHGVIVGSNAEFVAVRSREVVKLYRTVELTKQLTYDGADTGHGRFAPGNELTRKNGKDGMRTLLSEEREHMQTEAKRERDNGHGL